MTVPNNTQELVSTVRASAGHKLPAKALTSTLALVLLAANFVSPVRAADFTQSKKTYVPPSFIDRRVDFSSLREHQAIEDPRATGKNANTSIKSPSATGSAGNNSAAKHTASAKPNSAPHPATKNHVTPHTVAAAGKGEVLPPPSYPGIDLEKMSKTAKQHLHKLANSPSTAAQLASLKKQADELARSGKLTEAKQTLSKAMQLTDRDKQLLRDISSVSVEKAKQLANSQDFEQAARYARQALAIDGSSPEATKVLDGLLTRTGADPHDAALRLKTAEQLAAQGRSEEAAVEFAAANKIKPSAEAHIGMGNMAMRSNQKEKARAAFMQALEVDPASAAAHRQLGILKFNSGDLVGANSELSRALILNPNDKDASRSLIDLWQRQVSRVPNANSHLGLARAYQLAGDLQAAQTEYRTVVHIDPQNPHLPAARQAFKLALARHEATKAAIASHTLEDQGAFMDAYGKIIEAQRLSPGDPELRMHQGRILEKMQKLPAARQAYLDALKLNPQHAAAASRLKELPAAVDVQNSGGAGVAGSSILQGLGLSAPALAAAGMTPVNGDPVNQISNFAVQLRNHTIVQKQAIQKVEDTAHDIISKIGKPAPEADDTIHALAGADAASAATSSDVDSTLASAASALAAAKGALGKTGDATDTGARTKSSKKSNKQALESANNAPGTVQNLVSAPSGGMETPIMAPVSGAPAMATPQFNGNALTQAPGFVQQPFIQGPNSGFPAAVAPVASAIGDMPPLAPPIAMPVQQQSLDRVLSGANPASIPPNAMAFQPPTAMPQMHEGSPQLRPAVPTAPATAVKLNLESANVKLTGVELSVVLRNDSNSDLVIPDKMRAVIKYSNRNDTEVKASFANATVPSHSSVRGVIKVPFDKVDPNADLVLPNLLPPGSPNRDVHLITSMALR